MRETRNETSTAGLAEILRSVADDARVLDRRMRRAAGAETFADAFLLISPLDAETMTRIADTLSEIAVEAERYYASAPAPKPD
jgi:hypothetical protein